jgi:hypothetical protein
MTLLGLYLKSKDKENLKAHFSVNVEYDKESNESYYNEDGDLLEEEQEEEQET